MTAQHVPSEFPGRSMGPHYCLSCQSDWPCAGSRMEAAERADGRARTQVLIDQNRILLEERDALLAELRLIQASDSPEKTT